MFLPVYTARTKVTYFFSLFITPHRAYKFRHEIRLFQDANKCIHKKKIYTNIIRLFQDANKCIHKKKIYTNIIAKKKHTTQSQTKD